MSHHGIMPESAFPLSVKPLHGVSGQWKKLERWLYRSVNKDDDVLLRQAAFERDLHLGNIEHTELIDSTTSQSPQSSPTWTTKQHKSNTLKF